MIQFINQTDSIKTETLNCLIYGEPGIGKTSLSFTSKKPLLIDFDSGLQRACYRKDSIRVDSWKDVIEFQKSKELIEIMPNTLIIDTTTAMLDIYIADYVKEIDPKNMRKGGEISLQGYGAMKNVFSQFLDWSKSRKINLIFIAHLSNEQNGDEIKYVPKVTGGSYDILRQTMDLIGYISSNGNKRTIDFRPVDSHIGKDCAEIGLIEIPHYNSAEFKTCLEDLIDRTLKKMNDLSSNQVEIIKQLDEYKKKTSELENLEDFNKAINTLAKIDNRGIQIQMFNILKESASNKGYGYDKENKIFADVSTSDSK